MSEYQGFRALRRAVLITLTVSLTALPLATTGVAFGEEEKGKGQGQTRTDDGDADQGKGHAYGRDKGAPHGKAKGHGKGKKAKTKGKAKAPKAKGKATAPGQAKAKSHGPAGKTTICHATGSATNPYVRITISNNALDAHRRHQDGRDIIPAPANGCPGGSAGAKAKGKPANDHGKTTICHATGSEKNPYVKITISDSAVAAHRRHQDGRDIIPAPAGDCVAPTGTSGTLTAKGSGDPLTTTGPVATETARQGVLGVQASGGATQPQTGATKPQADVLGEQASGGPTGRVAGADAAAATGSLPFTGADLWIVATAALALLLAGFALRRVALGNRAS